MKNPKFRFWLMCTALWLVFIFFQSSVPASISNAQSTGLLAILNHFWPELTHDLLRQIAHFTEYFLLGGCAVGMFFHTSSFKFSKPMLFNLMVAVADETLQTFVEGRSGEFFDVWLDFGGAIVGGLIFWGILHMRKK